MAAEGESSEETREENQKHLLEEVAQKQQNQRVEGSTYTAARCDPTSSSDDTGWGLCTQHVGGHEQDSGSICWRCQWEEGRFLKGVEEA